MNMLRTLAVLGLSLSAQAETSGTMPKGTQHDPCAAIKCAVDHFCNVDATTGAAFCEKYQTIGGNTTNATHNYPCANIVCEADHFCNIDATGVAFCEKYQTMNHTQDPCAALKCDTDHFCNIDATGAAFCEKYQTIGGNTTNGTQNYPCANIVCEADSFCNIDATGVAFCEKYQTIGGNMTNATQNYPCANIVCEADSFCNIDATGVAFCEKYQTIGGNMTNGSVVSPPTTEEDVEWCMRVTERTAAERKTCCQYGFGCATKPFDCTTDATSWSEEQQMFCCLATRDGKGCQEECPATRAAQDDAGAYCCEVRGACGAEYFAEQSRADAAADEQSGAAVSTQVRTQLDEKLVDAADLLASPKAVLRRVRLHLLAASEELKQDPSLLTVTKIGLLENGAVPAAEKEQALTVPVPEAWNRALVSEEAALCEAGWVSTARGARVLAGTADARVYAEFRVAGSSTGTAEQTAQHVAAAVGGVKVAPSAPVSAPTSSSSSSSASGVAVGLGAALGALCLGGLVAFTVVRKRKAAEAGLVDIEMVEEYVHSEKHTTEYSPVAVSRM